MLFRYYLFCFFQLLLLPCIVFTRVTFNYNCGGMLAELFPTARNLVETYTDIVGASATEAEIVKDEVDKKIAEVTAKLMLSEPGSFDEATQQFNILRQRLFKVSESRTFVRTPEQELEDKMKLYRLYMVHRVNDVIMSFPFIRTQSPPDWISQCNFVNTYVKAVVHEETETSERRMIPRSPEITDFCTKLSSSLQNDPAWPKGQAKNAWRLVFRCYDMFPFDSGAAKKVFTLIKFFANFYAFGNFTSDGIGISKFINVLSEQSIPFQSHYRFQDYIKRTMDRSRDAHVSYKTPCYSQFVFVLPMFIKVRNEAESDDRIIITKVNIPFLEPFLNYEIIKIDGYPALQGFIDFAYELGKCRNTRVQLRYAFSKLYWDYNAQNFQQDRGPFLIRPFPPSRSYVVFMLKSPITGDVYEVKVDWMVFKLGLVPEFQDNYSYWKNICAAKPLVKKKPKLIRRNVLVKRESVEKRSPVPNFLVTNEGITPIVVGPEFAFFIMNDEKEGQYASLVINSFDVNNIGEWFLQMRNGFLKLIEMKIKKLLLDLSGNRGGILCLAYSLLGVLVPSPNAPFPATKVLYATVTSPSEELERFAKCVKEIGVKGSPFEIHSFLTENNTEFPDNMTWSQHNWNYYKNTAGFSQGLTVFSDYLVEKCQLKDMRLLEDVRPQFDNIVVLSDGFCGSSCAIVAANLQQSGYPAVVFRTDRSLTPQYIAPNAYSFAGGQVLNSRNVRDIAVRSSCFDLLPQVMEEYEASVTFRAAFSSTDREVPLEFLLLPSNASILYKEHTMNSLTTRWEEAFPLGLDISRFPDKYALNLSSIPKAMSISQ